jgi:hypothetical protein
MSAIELSRSPQGTLPSGEIVTYRKVSSMGNGFTFELQSLIFYSAIQAVFELCPKLGVDRRCRVYGDDIIVPTPHARPLIELLSFLGFKTNEEKSFIDGPFRESCGKHYFLGHDVTPFYIRENIDNPQKIYWFHNQFILWLRRAESNRRICIIDDETYQFLLSIRALLPEKERRLVPYGTPDDGSYLGDGAFLASFDETRPYLKRDRNGTAWVWIRADIPISISKHDEYYLLRQLYLSNKRGSRATEGGGTGITTRTKRGIIKIPVFQYRDSYLVM